VVEALINYIAEWIRYFFENMILWLEQVIGGVIEWLASYFQLMFDWFGEVFNQISSSITGWIGTITDSIVNLLTSLESAFIAFWDRLIDSTIGVFDELMFFINSVYTQLQQVVTSILNSITSWVNTLRTQITNLVQNAISALAAVAETTAQYIQLTIQTIIDNLEALFASSVAKIQDAYDVLMLGAESLVGTIAIRLSDLRSAFGEAATDIVAGISESAETTFAGLRSSVENTFTELSAWAEPGEISTLLGKIQSLLEGKPNPAELRKFVSIEWQRFVPRTGILTGIFFNILGLAAAVPLLTGATSRQADVYLQEFSKAYPHMLLAPADITAAWRRGFVSKEVAIDTIQRQGYTGENAEVILHLSDAVPNEYDAFSMFHREIIDDTDFTETLHQRGYSPEWIDKLKQASFLIPPVQDLITMAVREAFSPEIAEQFGQYEDFPEAFALWAKRQGLTEEWSKRYWAAHWGLPSPMQGFEMLHRNVIDEDHLNLLLRALDVMPYWRDKLTAIAFRPLTRVDVRRMHKMGVLTDKEVLRSYLDLGYNQVNAQLMTEFTLRYNQTGTSDNPDELATLSRSSILNFYEDGFLNRNRALILLMGLEYSEDASNLFLDSVDYDVQRKDRKAEVSLTISLAEAGVITFETAEDRLFSAGLTNAEVDKAIVDLLRKRQRTTKLPSRAEAEKMFREDVITLDDYKDLLDVMGYAEKWRDAYVSLIGKTANASTE